MEVILRDSDIGELYSGDYLEFEERKAARAILYNNTYEIALLKVENGQYHKLPGGGVEIEENYEDALQRELIEEVGARIKIEKRLGRILEYRGNFRQLQESHFYICKAKEIIRNPEFTEQEIKDGFNLIWCSMDQAIEMMKADRPTNYVGRFINRRDLIALENASKEFGV